MRTPNPSLPLGYGINFKYMISKLILKIHIMINTREEKEKQPTYIFDLHSFSGTDIN